MSAPEVNRPDVVVGMQKQRIPVTQYREGFFWRCQVCGWLGTRLFSLNLAVQEAGRHVAEAHPEVTHPLMERRDEGAQSGEADK